LHDSGAADQLAIAAWPDGPLRPAAPNAAVDLWIADLHGSDWPPFERLPGAERERAAAILRPDAAARWSAGRWALRTVLGRYLGEDPAGITLAAGERGKPRLADDPDRLSFNLSHSAGLALIAVTAGREVGVDVERVQPHRDFLALAERSLDSGTVAAVRDAAPAERAGAFYAAWVLLEARAKCDGGGLGARRRETVMATAAVEVGPGYAAALAVAGPEVPRLHEWSIGPPSARVRR
jgi:4'-phosphopantetheinyl transferase